jgi:hypothetical protein
MKNASMPAMVPHCDTALSPAPLTRPMKSILSSVLALGVAFGACAQEPGVPVAPDVDIDGDISGDLSGDLSGDHATESLLNAPTQDPADASGEVVIDMSSFDAPETDGVPPADDVGSDLLPDSSAPDVAASNEEGIDMSGDQASEGRVADFMKSTRISLKHEMSYKFASPKRLVNNRSSIRLEYSKLFAEKVFLRLDTKLNFHWSNDHRAEAKDQHLFRELVTREAYLQTSFGNTSLRFGHQILPWGVSEGGAITDEISPRNASEFFFVSLEESRIGQPMVTADHFNNIGQWTAFFVPRPAYNRYPDIGSEYDIPGAFDKPEPEGGWDVTDDYEYGLRWKRTFGKSDISLMAASLVDNDYLVRKQRFRMFGLTANIAKGNLLYRAEVALKQPKAYVASVGSGTSVVESDQFDSSFGFDYSPGGRSLVYSAEVVWSRLLDWKTNILGRERDEYALVGSVSNRFFNDDLTLSWLTIYNKPYTSFQHKFLSSYLIDDNSTIYFEIFYPDERDRRSANWPYRDQKQFVIRYQFQF